MREVLWNDDQKHRLAEIVGADDPLSMMAITQDVALPDAMREQVAELELPYRTSSPQQVRHLLEDMSGEFDPEAARRLHAALVRAWQLSELANELVKSEPFHSLSMEEFSRLQKQSTWLR